MRILHSTLDEECPKLEQESPTVLIERVAQGDEEAFASLYSTLEPRVYRFIYSKLNDSFEAADILNETFLEVWKSAGKFQGRSKATTWIFGIAYHKVMDHYRKKKPVQLDGLDQIEPIDETADQAAAMAALEEGDHLRTCLAKLKPAFRAVIELSFFEDLPYREIAEIVACPEGTVKTRVYHAKEALRHCLTKQMGDTF
ncbi:RNA polymerase sigma factor [Pelagibius sp. Alg239-R121]|uniref:RNA polymerase sigma factor n=1 Tax=Pelagibius sp. Alg239-R121 TaxID=2993448 RepID=UPI0024A6B9CD|nr:RNA polymerase sigma factor [Pelagibius sp. Alg239-R121]